MKEFISIKNLGPIKDIVIDDIKPITVLIGESGSGKSTLMKAIALFRWLYKMHNIRSYLKHSQVSKTPFRFRMDTYLKNCGFKQFIKASTEIVYKVEFENGNQYTITYLNQKLSGTSDRDLIKSSDLCFNKLSFISDTRNVIPLWADKGASFTGGYLGFYFHEVFRDFDIASDNVRDLELPYLGLKLGVKKTNSGKQYSVQGHKRDYNIDLKNSSSGTQNAVPVALIAEHFSKHFNFEEAFNRSVLNYLSSADKLTDFKPVKNLGELEKNLFIHIEEPELSLYPDAQCQLINDLIEKCFISNMNKIALIFSTHSPYIINNLNLLIKAADANKLIGGANIQFENLAVYQVTGGTIEDLIVKNERLVNTNPLSDTINEIYDQYSNL
ncbi:AAA family ATPase [Hymenobacter lapidiphilus]|uniref:AAA family ATPase n=1 Tax=Hymenobacter lapidiphilus TaxID=2608003 RepID=A0A7Y7PSE3_9BACT|nr:AAA family ATPase [Hymenobacter lapidiphilus]NVO33065.1 AAA family ATPase [Hymenobacter lapidiphilus]